MRRKRDLGYCELTTDTGGTWHLPLDAFQHVRHAWINGVPIIDTLDFHGARLSIKMARVDSICEITADALRSDLQDQMANGADDALADGGCV